MSLSSDELMKIVTIIRMADHGGSRHVVFHQPARNSRRATPSSFRTSAQASSLATGGRRVPLATWHTKGWEDPARRAKAACDNPRVRSNLRKIVQNRDEATAPQSSGGAHELKVRLVLLLASNRLRARAKIT